MRTFNFLLVVAGAAFVATCTSSSSTPSDGGPRGAGGQIGTGGAGDASALGGSNGAGGAGAAVDATRVPDPLAGCPTSPASSPCGPGAICAYSSQNGRVELDACMPVPSGCDSCSCLEDALLEFAKQFPDVSVPVGACSCSDGQQRVDGGTPTNPIARVACNGA
jgi:hypothetical protein